MNHRWMIAGLMLLAGSGLMGARECGKVVWAETNKDTYALTEMGTVTLHNDGDTPVYLSGCAAYTHEKKENGAWVDKGPDKICVWEGLVQPLHPGEKASHPLAPKGPGTWRARFDVAYGCTEGKPMSQAGCTSFETVYTPEYDVVP